MAEKRYGPIEPHVCYPLAEFKRRTGFADTALRKARQRGLRMRYLHKRVFVLGADFIDYLQREATDEPQ